MSGDWGGCLHIAEIKDFSFLLIYFKIILKLEEKNNKNKREAFTAISLTSLQNTENVDHQEGCCTCFAHSEDPEHSGTWHELKRE